MSRVGEALRRFFFGKPKKAKEKKKAKKATGAKRKSTTTKSRAGDRQRRARPAKKSPAKVEIVQQTTNRVPVPYWILRGWKQKSGNVYLGYFKTRLGRCHGVIKWNSRFDFGVYIHDLPEAMLVGPHGGCFAEVKPGKFRVHFARPPKDLNSIIVYLETLVQEAFENESEE